MRKFLPLFALLLFCGCTKTITKSDLDAKANEHNGFTFPDQTYYVGSKDGYDYFVIKRGLGGSKNSYRVPEPEQVVTNRFDLTKDETQWRGYGITSIALSNLTGNVQTNDLSYIYVVMMDNDQPKLEYDGEGLMTDTEADERGIKSQIFDCELIAMKIPAGQTYLRGGENDSPTNYLVHFSGTIERTNKDGIHVKGTVDSKIVGRIQFVKMVELNATNTDDFPEVTFGTGKTSVDFRGKVVGWLEKDSK